MNKLRVCADSKGEVSLRQSYTFFLLPHLFFEVAGTACPSFPVRMEAHPAKSRAGLLQACCPMGVPQ